LRNQRKGMRRQGGYLKIGKTKLRRRKDTSKNIGNFLYEKWRGEKD